MYIVSKYKLWERGGGGKEKGAVKNSISINVKKVTGETNSHEHEEHTRRTHELDGDKRSEVR